MPPVQATSLHFPQPALGFLNNLYEPSFYRYISVIIPMLLVNLINNLANVEAAAAVGDRYDAQSCLFASAVIDLVNSPTLSSPQPPANHTCAPRTNVTLPHVHTHALTCTVALSHTLFSYPLTRPRLHQALTASHPTPLAQSGSMLGNPFPSCVYLGHAAFKAMGCRVGYLYLSLVRSRSDHGMDCIDACRLLVVSLL